MSLQWTAYPFTIFWRLYSGNITNCFSMHYAFTEPSSTLFEMEGIKIVSHGTLLTVQSFTFATVALPHGQWQWWTETTKQTDINCLWATRPGLRASLHKYSQLCWCNCSQECTVQHSAEMFVFFNQRENKQSNERPQKSQPPFKHSFHH